ncbi:uncharacterized protein TRAVEDRAFT_63442, partial [Trametes versicolor FP-101664 SS1]|uniref:uncharacterized protein n=1 Tax=Trametes versicolor (strain FP-101664) TaxID=717944 RepID=UPI0004623149
MNSEILAAQNFLSGRAERSVKWKSLVKSDPRRTVRALTLTGFSAESIDGDTPWDALPILQELEDVSKNAKGDVWKRLVNAGLIAALCDNAVKMGQVGIMHDPSAPRPSKEELQRLQKQLPSPWYYPLAVICSGLVNCVTPPGATELRVVEDLKKHWHSVTECLWSDPSNSLEARATFERSVAAQIVVRVLTAVDPSFIEVLMDKKDRTFAVCMRNWLYSEGHMDCYLNASVLLPFLEQGSRLYTPPFWLPYLAEHPMPSAEVLLPRILEGASRHPEASAKKRNTEQTAAAVVAASAKHLALPETELTMLDLSLEIDLVRALVDHAKTAFPALPRAAYKSEPLWEGVVRGMRRAALAKKRKEKDYDVIMLVLSWCAKASKRVQEEGSKTVDKLIYAWTTAGLLDALEESLEFYVDQTSGGLGLVMILHELIESIPKLSAKTTTALRAQFPRPRLVAQLKKAVGNAEGDPMLIYQREIMKIDAGEQSPAAPSGLWKHGALEMVESLTALLGGSGQCARRGCAKPATGPPCHVERCEGTRYCSTICMEGDWGQHWEVCCDGDYKRIIERNNAILEI